MKINTDNNIFTYLFASILVIVVSVVLTGTQQNLKPFQEDNFRKEKMQNILKSIGINIDREKSETIFKETIVEDIVLDSKGNVIEDKKVKAFNINLAKEVKKQETERKYPLYIAKIDGKSKFIIPLQGSGLWGPIWGYMSIDADGETIYGAVFDHKGETPGLGAEITTPLFTEKFKGKKIFEQDIFKPIQVLKGNTENKNLYVVDALTGATITCNGVSEMLVSTLEKYARFLKSRSQS